MLPSYLKQEVNLKQAKQLIRDFKLNEVENKQVKFLSGGQKQRVAIARALIKNPKTFELAFKNFRESFHKYLLIALIFSIGILCLMFSLSSGNIMENMINQFKEKNTAFNNGYIKNDSNDNTYNTLMKDDRIENVYKQYKIQNVSLSINDFTEIITEKYPMPKVTESMCYGTIPQNKKNEIAITPSLAKKCPVTTLV